MNFKKKRKEEKRKEIAERISSRKIKTDWYYAIKWVAIITMLIDYLPQTIGMSWDNDIQIIMRIIGRISFPLFAWELVECFHHTKHKWKHFLKIGVIAIISEMPFDMAIRESWYDPTCQNVCFILLMSWLMLIFLNINWKKLYEKMGYKENGFLSKTFSKVTGLGFCFPIFILTYFLSADYTLYGIGLILLFEFARKVNHRKLWEFLAVSSYIGVRGIVIQKYYLICYLCLILFYLAEWDKNEKTDSKIEKIFTGKASKYFATIFYPFCLTVLAIITEVIR